jgi:tetratricopeptide (TPR) repeat protein
MYSNQKNTYNELYFDKDTNKYKFLQKIQYDNTTHVLRYFSDNGQSIISEHVVSNPSHFITKHGDQNTYDNTEYTRLYPTEEMLSGTNIEIKVQEAGNLIKNGYFSSALSILNDVLKTHGNPRGYYLRGGAHYGLKNYNAAIQDCNKALSYNINTNNASAVYYLRGLCHFLIEDKESGISDMEKAGEDGIKFLEENGFKKTKSVQKQNNNSRKVPTTKRNNSTPVLKKNK